jgi:hypothetical protein
MEAAAIDGGEASQSKLARMLGMDEEGEPYELLRYRVSQWQAY